MNYFYSFLKIILLKIVMGLGALIQALELLLKAWKNIIKMSPEELLKDYDNNRN